MLHLDLMLFRTFSLSTILIAIIQETKKQLYQLSTNRYDCLNLVVNLRLTKFSGHFNEVNFQLLVLCLRSQEFFEVFKFESLI